MPRRLTFPIGSIVLAITLLLMVRCLSSEKAQSTSHKQELEAQKYIQLGNDFAEAGRYDRALLYYGKSRSIYADLANQDQDSLIWKSYLDQNRMLSEMQREAGKFDTMQTHWTQALRTGVKTFGPNHIVVGRIYQEFGEALYHSSQFQAAEGKYEEALHIFQELGLTETRGMAVCKNNLGMIEQKLGNYKTAEIYLRQGLEIRKSLFGESDSLTAESYDNLGGLYYETGNLQRADTLLRTALEIRKDIWGEFHPKIADSYNNLGSLADKMGNSTLALEYLQQAIDIQHELFGDCSEGLGNSYHNLGFHFIRMGNFSKAKQMLEKGLSCLLTVFPDNDPKLTNSYLNLGLLAFEWGDLNQAEEYFLKGMEITHASFEKGHPQNANFYNNLGIIYQKKGDLEKAKIYFNRCLDLLRPGKEKSLEMVQLLANIGSVYFDMEDFQTGLEQEHMSLALAEEILPEKHPVLAQLYSNIGYSYLVLEDYEGAYQYQKMGLDLFIELFGENHPDLATVYMNLGNLRFAQEEYTEAKMYIHQALEVFEKHFPVFHPYLPKTFNGLGQTQLAEGNFQEALSAFDKSIGYFHNRREDPTYLDVELNGDLLLAIQGRGASYEQQFKITGNPQDLKASMREYQLAVNTIDSILFNLTSMGSKQIVLDKFFGVYEGLIRTGMELHQIQGASPILEDLFETAEKGKNVLLAQVLKSSKAVSFGTVPAQVLTLEKQIDLDLQYYHQKALEEYTQHQDSEKWHDLNAKVFESKVKKDSLNQVLEQEYPSYYNINYGSDIASLTEVQQSLDASTAMIEYFLGEENLYIFRITSSNVEVYTREIFNIDTKLEAFHDLFLSYQNRKSDDYNSEQFRQFAFLARELYQLLLAPPLDGLEDITELIIIPDGQLGYIPFDLLLMEEADTMALENENFANLPYLLKQYQIRYEYSSTLLLENSSTSHPSSPYIGFAPEYQPISRGNGVSGSIHSLYGWALQALPNAQTEIKDGVKTLKGKAFLGSEATKQNFLKHGPKCQVLHLAMHAFVNDSLPLYSAFAFSGAKGQEDPFLYAYELFNVSLNADLAILSACKTGIGKVQRGEGIMSLARAFKYAGCRNIVTSLWEVDDLATSIIMNKFYTYLREGLQIDQSLRKAKLDYLISGEKKHPFFWGAFVFIGEDISIQ